MQRFLFPVFCLNGEAKMLNLDSSRNLGGIGAILLIISVVAFFAQPLLSVLGLVGAILLLIALYGLAQFYREKVYSTVVSTLSSLLL